MSGDTDVFQHFCVLGCMSGDTDVFQHFCVLGCMSGDTDVFQYFCVLGCMSGDTDVFQHFCVLGCMSGDTDVFQYFCVLGCVPGDTDLHVDSRSLCHQTLSHSPLQVGDGTTSVVLIAAEVMRQCRPFIEDGVHPQIICRALRKATTLSLKHLDDISVHVKKDDHKYALKLSAYSP